MIYIGIQTLRYLGTLSPILASCRPPTMTLLTKDMNTFTLKYDSNKKCWYNFVHNLVVQNCNLTQSDQP